MESIYAGVITGFIIGTLGYTIVQFIVLPILRYKKIKKQAITAIRIYMTTIRNEVEDLETRESIEEKINAIKKQANSLMASYEQVMPNWYRLVLKNRHESPMDAAKHMMVLANTRTYEHAVSRVTKIKEALRI